MSQIGDNLRRVRDRIERATQRAGRSPEDITLIAVSKTVSVERMLEAIDSGETEFGESYVQETRQKFESPLLAERVETPNLVWHFIGHLQSNKAKEVISRFSLVHSVDTLSLAKEIGKQSVKAGRVTPILLESKIDPAETKHGFPPESTVETAMQVRELPGIELRGLMGMATYAAPEPVIREQFRTLKRLFDALPPENRLVLSMGMTNDFEIAIEEGATHLRVGTAIFGERSYEK